MIKTITFSMILLLGTSLCFRKKSVIGHWNLELIKLNDEIIFDRSDSSVSVKYNYSINSPQNQKDSSEVETMALSLFEKSKRIILYIDSDSTFISSKIRSGGKGDADDRETGTFYQSNDTLYMTFPERNNYKARMVYNKRKDRLYIEHVTDELTNYVQYCREN